MWHRAQDSCDESIREETKGNKSHDTTKTQTEEPLTAVSIPAHTYQISTTIIAIIMCHCW